MRPKLRFKDFEDVWVSHKLEESVHYTKGYAFKSENYSTNGGRIIRASDLKPNNIVAAEGICYPVDELRSLSKYKLKQGDIVITTVGSQPHLIESAVGRVHYFHSEIEDYYLNQNMVFLRTKNDKPHKFLSLIFQRHQYARYIKIIKRGNANQANITVQDLLRYRFQLPQFNEQVKLGNLFNSLDQKINLLTKKKEALETYKKGLMQKIFSQELRFKREDGTDYPEWKNLSLKDGVSDFVVPMRDKPKEFNGEVDWCMIEDIENGFINGSIAALRVSNEVISSMNLKVLPIGSVIISCSAYLGVCARVTKPLITNQTFIGLVPNDRVTTDFLYHLMTTKERILNRLSSGTTISYLSRSEFERLNIKLPCLEEQKKISSTLNVADNSIISVESQIRTTHKLKKGLLQQMFV